MRTLIKVILAAELVLFLASSDDKDFTGNAPVPIYFPRLSFSTDIWFQSAIPISSLISSKNAENIYGSISRSQDKEDIWAFENWFYGMGNGTILESGGLDGLEFSNSLMLERYAGWKAIHVEAHKVSFGRLKRNRPNAVNINCALCESPRTLHYVHSEHATVGGIYEFMSPKFIEQWHPDIHSGKLNIASFPAVQCVKVSALLSRLNVHHIDIWILDVEGAELSVLKGMDFKKTKISTIIMECDGNVNNGDFDKQKMAYLANFGYKCEVMIRNCMCTSNTFVPSKKPGLV
eukprot:gene9317-19343_t